ncbi:MAG: hypothetical protein J3Q66DRAFT_364247 [Benniella sp.]|nr:MAG: hypothetical protein J3Q66DRAFT_364247 [Benniella sp.]
MGWTSVLFPSLLCLPCMLNLLFGILALPVQSCFIACSSQTAPQLTSFLIALEQPPIPLGVLSLDHHHHPLLPLFDLDANHAIKDVCIGTSRDEWREDRARSTNVRLFTCNESMCTPLISGYLASAKFS